MRNTTPANARVGAGNELTLPDDVVQAMGLEVGDYLLVEVAEDDLDTIRLHRLGTSYAGGLRGVYGDPSESLEDERRSWR